MNGQLRRNTHLRMSEGWRYIGLRIESALRNCINVRTPLRSTDQYAATEPEREQSAKLQADLRGITR